MSDETETILPTSIRFPADLKEELERLAKADERSLSQYVVRVLRAHVRATATVRKFRT